MIPNWVACPTCKGNGGGGGPCPTCSDSGAVRSDGPQSAIDPRAYHRHCRRMHKAECECEGCASNGREPCNEKQPCPDCRDDGDEPDTELWEPEKGGES